MKNKKGFTLTELLVVVVILGIITLISLPVIRNISEANEKRQYDLYRDSLKSSTKLYIDTYGEDIFGRRSNGCKEVTYQTLYDKGYIKDIEAKGITCASTSTFVRVVKVDNSYSYTVFLGCGNKDHLELPIDAPTSDSSCRSDTNMTMDIKIDLQNGSSRAYKSRTFNLNIKSFTGISDNPNIYYGFSTNPNWDPDISQLKRLPIQIPGGNDQRKTLEAGQPVTATFSLTTPENATGVYYLILKIEQLYDLNGDYWHTDLSQKRLSLGPITVDNTKPALNSSTIVSSENGYNALQPKLSLNATDVLTPTASLKMCITYDNETACPTTEREIKKTSGGRYEAYNATKKLKKIQDAYKSSNHVHRIYLTIADEAGNFIQKTYNYEVAYQLTYNANGGTGTMTPTYCNNNATCTIKNTSFTRPGFGYKGWFTATAGGTKYGATTKITKDTDIYAQWSACAAGTYSTNNNCSNCPANSYSDGASNASCTACPAGMTSAASSKSKTACKVTCAAGKYLAKNTSACAACPVGSYCGGGTYYFNASADQGKTACPSGMTSAAGSSVKTACKITCAAGKYLAANGTSCSNCPAGKYCKGGTYNFNTSANQGITGNCNANTYSTGSAGAATCTACPSGMTSAAGSTAKTACKITCAAGKYLAANGTSCANCPANNYCLGGTFNYSTSANQGNTACPSGYSSPAGSNAKTKCYINCGAGKRVTSANGTCTGGCSTGYTISSHTVYSGNTSPACTPIVSTVSFNKQGGSGGTGSVNATYASAMPSISVPTRSYTVNFNFNGGSGTPASRMAYYTFEGYYTSSNGSGTKYYNNNGTGARNWDKTSATTLYAYWSSTKYLADPWATGSWYAEGDGCGGTGCWCGCCNSCGYGLTINTNSVVLPSASRGDHSFNGWYTAPSGGSRVGGAGDRYTPSSNVTLYAQWTYTPPPPPSGGGGGGGEPCGSCWCGCCCCCAAEHCESHGGSWDGSCN